MAESIENVAKLDATPVNVKSNAFLNRKLHFATHTTFVCHNIIHTSYIHGRECIVFKSKKCGQYKFEERFRDTQVKVNAIF